MKGWVDLSALMWISCSRIFADDQCSSAPGLELGGLYIPTTIPLRHRSHQLFRAIVRVILDHVQVGISQTSIASPLGKKQATRPAYFCQPPIISWSYPPNHYDINNNLTINTNDAGQMIASPRIPCPLPDHHNVSSNVRTDYRRKSHQT